MAERSKQARDAVPRAHIHKKILDHAEGAPDASVETIAESVAGATPELVTSVLEEYGDPAADGEQSADQPTTETQMDTDGTEAATDQQTEDAPTETGDAEEATGSSTDDASAAEDSAADSAVDADPTPDGLSEAQMETLRAVHRRPEATQRAIADELGVVRATVSNRLTDIEGFAWPERRAFVEALFEEPVGTDDPDAEEGVATDGDAPPEDADAPPEDANAGTERDETEQLTVETVGDADEEARADHAAADEVARADHAEDHAEIIGRLEDLEATVSGLDAAAVEETSDHGSDESAVDAALLEKAARAILDDDRIDEGEAMTLLRHLL